MSDNDADCIVIRCSGCKRVIYAAVNKPRVMTSDAFKEIGEIVSNGHNVEHMTAEDVRKADWRCECEQTPTKKRKGL